MKTIDWENEVFVVHKGSNKPYAINAKGELYSSITGGKFLPKKEDYRKLNHNEWVDLSQPEFALKIEMDIVK